MSEKLYKLQGKILHYAWGGYDFLPSFLGIANTDHRPFAEYWMGAHPSAPSELIVAGQPVALDGLIRDEPTVLLSAGVAELFSGLPYLFKVQDVREILSIQVHPSREEAQKGFEREEAAGIPITAPHRNYKDRNHKPEMLVALSEFWLLHGFKQKAEIEATLASIYEFKVLLPYYKREGLKALYGMVMEMEQQEINALLRDLVKREIRNWNDGLLTKEMPGWWVAKLYQSGNPVQEIDRAVFSIYLFNIVKLNPGEALFQGAGVPHAYLEGQDVELMANSDNVLRAGLTPKHIDVPELIKHTSFEPVTPRILQGVPGLTGETLYPCPVKDFGIARIELTSGTAYSNTAASFEILVVTEGGAVINNSMVLKRGEAVAVLAGGEYTIQASGHSTLFKAFVPPIASSQAGEN
ncbi:MAG: mannose-6-phosphate isomerase, class I [Chitinophagaceae bacterium]|nr:mannose-6-phosphate isomerase, class I [Chitinophagaceae bacterium]